MQLVKKHGLRMAYQQDNIELTRYELANECTHYPQAISELINQYFEERVINTWQGQHILKGKIPSIDSLIFSSNDYLHISQHPLLLEAQIKAMLKHGNGQMQSAVFLSQNSSLLDRCEKKFNDFVGFPASLLTQSGWCANVGVIQALAKPHTPVYLDFFTHMSFWTGVRAARARAVPFYHNSVDSLQKRLEQYGSGIIAIDSIYSTHGSISPIKEYLHLARFYKCLLIVDESHSLGTHGPEGRGLVAELGLSQEVDIITASLAKAFSGRGGVVAGKKFLIEFLRYSSFPTIFSSGLAPQDLAGFSASLDIIKKEQWRRDKLYANVRYLREALIARGFNLKAENSQIIPIITGHEKTTMWLRDELEKRNIFGSVFCAPATPKNKSLIRFSISAHHEKEMLDYLIHCCTELASLQPNIPFFKNYLATDSV